MKTTSSILLAGLFAAGISRAEIISWTNTAGGSWSANANWSPNRAPAAGDTAVVTNAGTYTVSLSIDPVIAGLVVGGESGTQTLATASRTLTLNGEGSVAARGRLLLSGGALSGTNLIRLSGGMTWQSGYVDTNTILTVSPGANITLASAGNSAKTLYGTITNGGTVTWQLYGNLVIGGSFHNLSGALFDAQVENRSIVKAGDYARFVNAGTFRKSAGNGETVCNVPLSNCGTLDVQSGTLTFSGGSENQSGATFVGAGLTWLEGTNTVSGDLYSSNLCLRSSTILGNSYLHGTVTWADGDIAADACVNVAADGHLLLKSGANYARYVHGNLTNYGTVTFSTYGSLNIGGAFHNLPGAVFDAQTDNRSILKAGSTAIIINDGVFRRSVGTQYVGCAVPIINNGTMEILSGTIQFDDVFSNPAGAIFIGGATLKISQPLLLAGGHLTGWGTLDADLVSAGTVSPSRTNGTLTIHGDYEQTLPGAMEFEIAGNTPGAGLARLNITGSATLAGTISLRWVDDFVPSPGTDFQVLACASRQGEFCCFDNFILLGRGLRIAQLYSRTNLDLVAIVAPEPDTVPLRVVVDGSALVCWPAEFAGYELYWCTNLTHSNWTLVSGATNRYLEPPPLAHEKFFRLHKP